jgi:hypothetical protein
MPLVEGHVLLLFLVEQIYTPCVNGPLCLVVHLHDLQGRPVISVVVVDVAWVADPDALRHPRLKVILLSAVHAVI